MNGSELVAAVRGDSGAELAALDSRGALYVLAGGALADDAVRRAVLGRIPPARKTFHDVWAMSETDKHSLMTGAASDVVSLYDHIKHRLWRLGEDYSDGDGFPTLEDRPAIQTHLREREDEAERLGGIVGWALVEEGYANQLVGQFVGRADPGRVDELRAVRDAYEHALDATITMLNERCSDDDRAVARAAANETIDAAYTAYCERVDRNGLTESQIAGIGLSNVDYPE